MTVALEGKVFCVNIEISMGEYQKNVKSFVESKTESDAIYMALCGETHHQPLTREEFNQGKTWWDGDMIYTASASELPGELAATIKKYNGYPYRFFN